MSNNFLDQLNEVQRQAVEYCDGAQLVIAGAGSGKTRVLTYKIAHLLSRGMAPWNILALTFTNKAAREMKERIGKLVGAEHARYLNMGTFHSVFARILRSEAAAIGYNSSFTIYDRNDSISLIKAIIKEKKLDKERYVAATIVNRITMAKNDLILPQKYAASTQLVVDDTKRNMPMIKDVYMEYSRRCIQANAMDFDDLLLYMYVLLKDKEEIRKKYVEKFKYVLVDEYQDTNRAQQAIVWLLTKERQNICVVGDDAQSIYSFRGANIGNILNFTSLYKNARSFKLEQNYRSTQNIVLAANSLIRHNQHQIPKDTFSHNEQGNKLIIKTTDNDQKEAAVVCADIERIRRQDHCAYDKFAILYRTNAQSRRFEEQMSKDGIPYRIYGGLSFYQRKEIKDVIAYLRLVVNPNDEEALRRIINYPKRGIGDTTVAKISDTANRNGVSMWEVLKRWNFYGLDVSKGATAKLDAFVSLVESWRKRQDNEDVCTLCKNIINESGIRADISKGYELEDISRRENINELLNSMYEFVSNRKKDKEGAPASISEYLQEVALLSDLDSEGNEDEPKVTLMTIHSAKGLEFPTVFVVGMEENIFPSLMCCDTMRGLEEERRLLYVAITRAEKRCILTCAQERHLYGDKKYNRPSRFLSEIDPQFVKTEGSGGYGGQSFFGGSSGSRPEWQQNPHPVASQFVADPKPRVIPPRRQEPKVDPFSDDFKRKLEAAQAGRNLQPVRAARLSRVSDVISSPQSSTASPARSASVAADIRIGSKIEHPVFGLGSVTLIEGTGENMKITIDFVNMGTKKLLMKFAKFKVI